MKPIIIFLLSIGLAFYVQGQNNGQCHQCNMLIKDFEFTARYETESKTLQFDAIECLINFIRETPDVQLENAYVTDFMSPGSFLKAREATYLKSKKLPSPMGAYLSAYQTFTAAEEMQQLKGGTLMNWDQLLKEFNLEDFGMMGHPDHQHHTPGAYAPIGVMGDHLHHAGGFMISIRYMTMGMSGMISGSDNIDDTQVLDQYMMTPQEMEMSMQMVGVMYAPSERVTLMLMQNVVQKNMSMLNRMGSLMESSSRGLGETRLSVLFGLLNTENSSLHLNTSIGFPTGKIDMVTTTPMNDEMLMPYPMQLGSGSVEGTLGITYKGGAEKLKWGIQSLFLKRINQNNRSYKLGDQYQINSWLSYGLSNWLSVSTRMSGLRQNSIQGVDEEMHTMMSPMANSSNSGFSRLIAGFGLNFSFGNQPVLQKFKAGVEYARPVFQQVEGMQMKSTNQLIFGLRYSI